jgi:transportin-3
VFTCLKSWLTEIPIDKVTSTLLLRLSFESLFSPTLFEEAVDFIVAMIHETRNLDDGMLSTSVAALNKELYALSRELTQFQDDPDTFRGITRIYSEAGEAWSANIAKEPETFAHVVTSLVHCTSYQGDLDITKITFNSWYYLTQNITVEHRIREREYFIPVYKGLVDVMIGHLHYPEGNDRNDIFDGDRVAEDKFRDFRHEMGDILKDCCRVVGGSECLVRAYVLVQTKLDEQVRGMNVRWQDIEAPLFSMRMMAREVEKDEDQVVPEVMKLLVNLPEHDKIRYAATLVLGRYTEWTARHPQYLEFQLNYISSGFENQSKEVISAAAQALKHFCQDCKNVYCFWIGLTLAFGRLFGTFASVLSECRFGLGH